MAAIGGITVGLTARFLLVALVALLPMFVLAIQQDELSTAVSAVALSLCLGTGGVFLITRQLDRSLARLQRATEKFASGDLDYRVYPSRIPQLVGLAKGLNAMGGQLRERVNALVLLTEEQDAILRSMVEGVITVNSSGRIMRLNQAAIHLLAIATEDTEDRSVPEVVHHAELQRFMAEAMAAGRVTSATVALWSSLGQTFLEVTASPLFGAADNEPTGMLFVLHDITRVKRLEQVRKDFVGNVSHELKTPITSIKGFVETLLDGAVSEPDMGKKFLEIISRHTDRLSAIVNDLLTLSRLEASGNEVDLEFTPHAIRAAVSGAVETCSALAQSKNIDLSYECPGELRAVINPSLMEQAIVNLIDNGLKHTEIGGSVSVKVSSDEQMVRIDVSDTGCGIEKNHLPRLFERFYRIDQGRSRKHGGTGLGLSIVKHICQVHGGRVDVSSVLGKGSVFSIFVRREPYLGFADSSSEQA